MATTDHTKSSNFCEAAKNGKTFFVFGKNSLSLSLENR